jgi:hypothetical protein
MRAGSSLAGIMQGTVCLCESVTLVVLRTSTATPISCHVNTVETWGATASVGTLAKLLVARDQGGDKIRSPGHSGSPL